MNSLKELAVEALDLYWDKGYRHCKAVTYFYFLFLISYAFLAETGLQERPYIDHVSAVADYSIYTVSGSTVGREVYRIGASTLKNGLPHFCR